MCSTSFEIAGAECANKISSLAKRSKAYWGYSDEFMAQCSEELTFTFEELNRPDFTYVVALDQSAIVGFYALAQLSSAKFELDSLYVEPIKIGQGIGKKLIEHALKYVASLGGKEIVIQSDPHAEKFYCAAGAVRCSERESASIPGRFLPLLSLKVKSC